MKNIFLIFINKSAVINGLIVMALAIAAQLIGTQIGEALVQAELDRHMTEWERLPPEARAVWNEELARRYGQ